MTDHNMRAEKNQGYQSRHHTYRVTSPIVTHDVLCSRERAISLLTDRGRRSDRLPISHPYSGNV